MSKEYKEKDKNRLWTPWGFMPLDITGTDKGKSFKRKSKGKTTRENRRYTQDHKSGVVILL